jgi:hypothetical protein
MSQDHSPTIPMSCHLQCSVLKRVRAGVSHYDTLLCLALILIHLIPIWAFKYFPSQDGPAHMNNATIIREYHDRPIFREYYSLNKDLVPNWVGHLVLTGLMSLMPALVAEKMLLSGYVILLPLSVCYVLHTIHPDGTFLTVLIFPFVYNLLLHMGFYNFSYSLVMFFFVVGYWLKHYEGFTRRDMLMLTILSLVLYFCHIVSLVDAYMAIGLLTMWLMGCDLAHQLRTRQLNLRALCDVRGWWDQSSHEPLPLLCAHALVWGAVVSQHCEARPTSCGDRNCPGAPRTPCPEVRRAERVPGGVSLGHAPHGAEYHLLPLHFSPYGYAPDRRILSSRVAPFMNASGHIAAQRGIVDLQNYEAMGNLFPVMFRPHLNPLVHIWYGAQFQSPAIDFLSYPQRTGGRVDYILVWRTSGDSQDDPVAKFYRQLEQSISQQLEEGYELIYISPQRGFLKLYRRKDWRH